MCLNIACLTSLASDPRRAPRITGRRAADAALVSRPRPAGPTGTHRLLARGAPRPGRAPRPHQGLHRPPAARPVPGAPRARRRRGRVPAHRPCDGGAPGLPLRRDADRAPPRRAPACHRAHPRHRGTARARVAAPAAQARRPLPRAPRAARRGRHRPRAAPAVRRRARRGRRLGACRMSAATRVPRWLRVTLPAVLILVWLGAAAIGGPYFGRVDEVSSNDRTAYLPSTAEATAVQDRLADFTDGDAIPAVVVFTGEGELSRDD